MKKKVNLKEIFKKRKKFLFLGLGATMALSLSLLIYFSQTMYFYTMKNFRQSSSNVVDSLNGGDNQLLKKYKRKEAATLNDPLLPVGTDPVDFYPNFFKAQNNTEILNQIFDATNPATKGSVMSDEYIDNAVATNTLKQHPAAKYMYQSYVDSSVLAVSKKINIDLKRNGWHSTGLYIPAGEIVEINFPGMTDEEVQKLNISIVVGSNEVTNAIKQNIVRTKTRMPHVVKTKKIDKANFRYGTPFGGLISIDSGIGVTRDATNVGMVINNAVEALYYVHGKTTLEEWQRLTREAKAPVFDLVTDTFEFYGQNYYLSQKYNHDLTQLPFPYEALDIYRKLTSYALDATSRFNDTFQTIRITYSNYMHTNSTTAAAVSAQEKWFITATNNWCANILDKDFVAKGDWGTIHEFTHQLQISRNWLSWDYNPFDPNISNMNVLNIMWGFYKTGGAIEVTNNTLNIMSYIKYLDIQNDRYDPKLISGHGKNFNGFTAMSQLNDKVGRSMDATEPHYTAVMGMFGAEKYNTAVKAAYDSSTKGYNGKIITTPWFLENYDLHGTFVYDISMATGYDWSDFYNSYGLLDKALKPGDEKYSGGADYNPPFKEKTPYQKLQEIDEIKALKKIHPAYSFYASEVSYENEDNYNIVARPFKVSGTEPTTLKIQEYTNTNNKLYELSNFELVKQPKYGYITQDTSSGNIEYKYTPNQRNKNDLDEFVYKVKSTQKANMNGSATTISNTTTSQDNSSDIYFKVQLFQDDGTYKWQSPEITNDDLKISATETNLNSYVDTENIKVYNATNDTDVLDEKASLNAKNLFDGEYKKNYFEPSSTFGRMKIVIPFKEPIDVNKFTFTSRGYNQANIPTDIEIFYKDINDSQVKKLYNNTFNYRFSGSDWNNAVPTVYNIDDVTTNELTLYFNRRDAKGVPIANTHFKFDEFSFSRKNTFKPVLVTNQNIRLRGTWKTGFADKKINNSTLLTSLPGSQLEFAFDGDRFSINANKDTWYGDFEVFIDNVSKGTISLKSKSRMSDQTVFDSGKLSNSKHNVKIISKSTKPIEFTYFGVNGNVNDVTTVDLYYFYTVGIPLIIFAVIAATSISIATIKRKKGNKK